MWIIGACKKDKTKDNSRKADPKHRDTPYKGFPLLEKAMSQKYTKWNQMPL